MKVFIPASVRGAIDALDPLRRLAVTQTLENLSLIGQSNPKAFNERYPPDAEGFRSVAIEGLRVVFDFGVMGPNILRVKRLV